MSDTAVTVEQLGKRYQIGAAGSYRTLRETITSAASAPVRRLLNPGSASGDVKEFWALRDVSFEVPEGQAVGIIGRNGAGKSTLLKVLSRITHPTEGHIHLSGRVGSLLEVGTGFHSELSGRENIYMNGAILGMPRAEIRKKFDEIVAFSEIEDFLDTPVKRYSSGMYVRLAFSVAAHLEPEILIVDEVLAVGDLGFQRKCLGKMQDVTGEGRTVLFVSHNIGAVLELCDRGILLEKGGVVEDGPTSMVVNRYLSGMQSRDGVYDLDDPGLRMKHTSDSAFAWTRLTVIDSQGHVTGEVGLKEPFEVVLEGYCSRPVDDLELSISMYSGTGVNMFNSSQVHHDQATSLEPGPVAFRVAFDPNLLAPGQYLMGLWATAPNVLDYIRVAAQFSVSIMSEAGDSLPANYAGVIVYPCRWSQGMPEGLEPVGDTGPSVSVEDRR